MSFKWLDFKITNRCNNRCIYCGVQHDHPSAPEVLSIDEITMALSDAINLGFTHFALLGGEPSIRANIDHVFSPFDGSHGINLLVITNGLQYNQKMCEAAFKSGASEVKIICSFDSFASPNYKHQDPKKVLSQIAAIQTLARKYRTNGWERGVEIHSVISRENIRSISQLVRHFKGKEIEVSLALVCPSIIVQDRAPAKYNEFTKTELNHVIDQLKDLEHNKELNFANKVLLGYLERYIEGTVALAQECRAGKEHVIINPDGEVYPCITEAYSRGLRFGNIQKERFRDIYPKLQSFQCMNDFSPSCWDHYLWNKLGENLSGGKI